MKNLLLPAVLFFSFLVAAQKPKIISSPEMRTRVSTGFNEIIYTDENETLVRISGIPNPYFSIDPVSDQNTIVKFDKDLKQVYETQLDEKIKDGNIYMTLVIEKDIWLICHAWKKKEKQMSVFARKFNKQTGAVDNAAKEIMTFTPADVQNGYSIFVAPGSSEIFFAAKTDAGTELKTSLQITTLDKELNKKTARTASINIPEKEYTVANICSGKASGKLSVAGMHFKTKGKKKNELRYLDRVVLSTMDGSNTVAENVFSADGYMLSSASLQAYWTNDNKMLLATFLHEPVEDDRYVLLNHGILTASFDLDKAAFDYTRKSMFTMEDMKWTSDYKPSMGNPFLYDPYKIENLIKLENNNGFILLCEATSSFSRTVGSVSGNYSRTISSFNANRILVFKFSQAGEREWTTPVIKYQTEAYTTSAGFHAAYAPVMDPNKSWKVRLDKFPFYSGYGLRQKGDQLEFYFNEDPSLIKSIAEKDNFVKTDRFDRSHTVCVTVHTLTGVASKRAVYQNSEDMILMPRWMEARPDYVIAPAQKIRNGGLSKNAFQVHKLVF